ncbi:MAG: SPOR domain-containing protein [Pseudomonadota bacterium]
MVQFFADISGKYRRRYGRSYVAGLSKAWLPLAVGALLLPVAQLDSAAAQGRAQSSLEVKSPEGTRELSDALRRLSRNSRDLNALIDAGNAALVLGDPTAAIGFFARADEIDPRNGRVKAGLASAVLGSENPYEALRLFDQAVALGVSDSRVAADRGLAYDLVGKQDLAQQDYKLALRRRSSDEVTRRYALSLGISGQREEAEALLTPLLNRRDVDAWRIRAFVLAINEDIDGAIAISDATMQPRGARAIRPFLRYFPRLTPSQQAAAAHFGHFPQEANIGRDNPRNAEFASRSARSSRRTSRADAGLIPVGEPLGGGNAAREKPARVVDRAPRRRPGRGSSPAERRVSASAAEAVAAGENAPQEKVVVADVIAAPEQTAAAKDSETLTQSVSTDAPGTSSAIENLLPEPEDQAMASAEETVPVPGFESLGDPATSSFDLADANGAASTDTTPGAGSVAAEADTAEAQTSPPASFASLMADIAVPESEMAPDEDAVDITSITPAKAKPKPAPKPKEPKHPSRHWVQVAGGANVAGLSREWRRLVKAAPKAFAGKKGWTTPLNRTNRVLAGPFGSKREAQAFVNLLAKSEISAFTFTSAEGQEIKPLK